MTNEQDDYLTTASVNTLRTKTCFNTSYQDKRIYLEGHHDWMTLLGSSISLCKVVIYSDYIFASSVRCNDLSEEYFDKTYEQ